MNSSSEHNLPESDNQLLNALGQGLPNPEDREVLSPADIYHGYLRVKAAVDVALKHAYQVVEHFQSWRRPMDASTELEKVDGYIKELEKMNEQLLDEISASLGIVNKEILDTAPTATEYIAFQPKQPRIAAESILREYEERLAWIEKELEQEKSIQEAT